MSAGAPLHFWRRGGKGPPLLLIHGFAGHGESWADFAPLLPSDRTVASITLPGHDPACPVREGATFGETVGEVASLAAAELGRPFEAIGYSLGGRVLLGLLVRCPELLVGATVIGANPGLEGEEARRERAAWEERWIALLLGEGIDAFVRRWETLPLFGTQRGLTAQVIQKQRVIRTRHDAASLAASLRLLGLAAMPDYWPALPSIDRPVRLVAGERDGKFTAIARRIDSLLPSSTLSIVPKAGHNVLLEKPGALAGIVLSGARIVRKPFFGGR